MSKIRPWVAALTLTGAAEWDVRERAAEELGGYLDEREVRTGCGNSLTTRSRRSARTQPDKSSCTAV
jgi:hypothetical protein